jgi:hypothetical protein
MPVNGSFAPAAAILERPAFVPKLRSLRSSGAALIGHAARSPVSKASRSVSEVVAFAPWCSRGGALQELRRVMARLARGRTLGGIAAELGLQFDKVGEDVGLAAQWAPA